MDSGVSGRGAFRVPYQAAQTNRHVPTEASAARFSDGMRFHFSTAAHEEKGRPQAFGLRVTTGTTCRGEGFYFPGGMDDSSDREPCWRWMAHATLSSRLRSHIRPGDTLDAPDRASDSRMAGAAGR